MKKLVVFIILFIIILASFMVYMTLSGRDIKLLNGKNNYNLRYHFVIIAQQKNDIFCSKAEEGARFAAKDLQVAIQYIGPEHVGVQQEIDFLELAIASRVDGIITHVSDEDKLTSVINKAVESGIPVITMDTDAPESKRISYVGTNNYAAGEKAANVLLEVMPENAVIGVLAGNYESNQQNMRIQGFVDKLAGRKVEIKKIIHLSDLDVMEAMDKTQLLLNSGYDINILFCTNPVNTIGAARGVVDLNRVGNVKIIGFDDLPEIRRLVEKEVISAVIVQDPYLMGKLAVQNMYNYKEGKQISVLINTDVRVASRQNINSFE